MPNEKITIQTTIQAPVSKVWDYFTEPTHIVQWNNASPDWHTTSAENDLTVAGKFNSRMEAKDGSTGFDFWGTYDEVLPNEKIAYTLGDGRTVEVLFEGKDGQTQITETFEAEGQNPIEMQRNGWQAILDNFKKHVER